MNLRTSLSVVICLGVFWAYAAKPKLSFQRKGKGPNGYDNVIQTWVNDDNVNIKCTNPGYETCEFTSGSANFPPNMDERTKDILLSTPVGEGGTFTWGEHTYEYLVVENLGGGDGTVEYIQTI
jgi:hypothetical protein